MAQAQKTISLIFPQKQERFLWLFLLFLGVPASFFLRFYFMENPLLDVHPIRQCQTALTTYYFAQGHGSLFDYRSPLDGKLWSFVYEFPFYQWVAAGVMRLGFSLEVASRLVSILFFALSVAVVVFYLYRNIGKREALWALVLLLTNPFMIIFSRASLIDFTVVFFSFGMTVCVWESLKERRAFWVIGVMFVSGLLAATIKFNVFAVYGLWLLPWLLMEFFQGTRARSLQCIAVLAACAVVGVAWNRWAGSLSGSQVQDYSVWVFGPLKIRLEGWRWIKIFGPILSRGILRDWLVVPFLLGLMLPSRHRKLALWSVAVILIYTVIFFNILTYHDYYFIAVYPLIFTIVAIGIVRVFELSTKPRLLVLFVMAGLLANELRNLPVYFESIFFDYRTRLAHVEDLKKQTDANDVIYYNTDGLDAWEVPLYSQRYATTRRVESPAEINPTVIRLARDTVNTRWFEAYDQIWFTPRDSESTYFRVRETPTHPAPGEEDIVMTDKMARLPDLVVKAEAPIEVNACGKKAGSYFIKLERAEKHFLDITVSETSQRYLAPAKKFLVLPIGAGHGCKYTVSVVPEAG